MARKLGFDSSCRLCGSAIKQNQKYRQQCTPAVVKENIAKAGALGRLNTHSPAAQARRAETQRRQNAALKAWSPEELPDWLDRKCYEEKIRPLLTHVPVPRIIATINVSEPYALAIRAGKRIPHPRHWVTIAHLTGTSKDTVL